MAAPIRSNGFRSRSDANAAKNSSIGIYNVRRRLLLYYNETMKIASTPDKGTTVSFRVPVRE